MCNLKIGDKVKVVSFKNNEEVQYRYRNGRIINADKIKETIWTVDLLENDDEDEPGVTCYPEDYQNEERISFYREELTLARSIRRAEI
jgi:hypothetical protein